MAQDIALETLGCLYLIWFMGNKAAPFDLKFAEMIAEELDSLETKQPRGDISPEESGTIAYKRDFYDVRSAGAGHAPMEK